MEPTKIETRPAEAFDCGTATATPDIVAVMTAVTDMARENGLDLQALCQQCKTTTKKEAPKVLQAVHNAASLLFLQWQRAIQKKAKIESLALARLFNGLTYGARFLDARFDLIDKKHLNRLAEMVKKALTLKEFDPEKLGDYLNRTALAHTHERGWAWVVLPTFAKQPYGRILLTKIEIPGFRHPIFVTQPFFLPGQSTLFHTHGQNWAYSRPLGPASAHNTHINTLWMTNSGRDPFPLELIDLADYESEQVAILPPKVIHGIARKRGWGYVIPSLPELLQDDRLQAEWIAKNRFGELACMHIYCPCKRTSDHLKLSPFCLENDKFFIEYDMIVFDHLEKTIWSGGGGSWPRRMIEYGTTGAHCGICFEDDGRKENLDPEAVNRWFIQKPVPPLILMDFQTHF